MALVNPSHLEQLVLKYGRKLISSMANQKCVSCGIGFFSQTRADKCAGQESQGHDSCGCGNGH